MAGLTSEQAPLVWEHAADMGGAGEITAGPAPQEGEQENAQTQSQGAPQAVKATKPDATLLRAVREALCQPV